jgi:hypothetical protein
MSYICRTDGLGVTKHDEHTEPNGTPLVSRLTELGQQMDKDIHACYNGAITVGLVSR